MDYDKPELLNRLAAEYVLGTLRGRALNRFERLQLELPRARQAVAAWEESLNALAAVVPAAAPPGRVWEAIERKTGANRTAPAPRRWDWLRPILGVALGAVLTLGLVQLAPHLFFSLDRLAQREQALPQSYVGLLTDANNVPHLLVSSTRHGTRVTVKSLRPWQVPAGKVAQVWALPRAVDGGDLAPVPLGVAVPTKPPGSTYFELSANSEQLLSNVPRLAVSFEERPATTGEAPSAYVFSGFCVKLW